MEKLKIFLVFLSIFIFGIIIIFVVVDTEIKCVENESYLLDCEKCSLDNGCLSRYGVHLDSTLLECSWYPLYCGFGTNNLCGDLSSIVLFGWDLTMCRTYEYGNEKDYEEIKGEIVEAQYGVDYIIKDIQFVTDRGVMRGFVKDGEVSTNISDWDIIQFIKDLQFPSNYGHTFRWIVEYEVYSELHSVSTYIDMVRGDDFDNPDTIEIKKGNEDEENTNKSIKKGVHYAIFSYETNIFEILYDSSLCAGNIRVEGYKYMGKE